MLHPIRHCEVKSAPCADVTTGFRRAAELRPFLPSRRERLGNM
jgi:hypothetical protein